MDATLILVELEKIRALLHMVMIVSAVQTIACVLIVGTYFILRLVDEIRELKDRLEDRLEDGE